MFNFGELDRLLVSSCISSHSSSCGWGFYCLSLLARLASMWVILFCFCFTMVEGGVTVSHWGFICIFLVTGGVDFCQLFWLIAVEKLLLYIFIFPGLRIKPRTSHVLGKHSAAALSMFFVGVSLLKKNIQSFVQFKFLYLLDGTVIPAASDGHCRCGCATIQARAPGLSNFSGPAHYSPALGTEPSSWAWCSLEAVSHSAQHNCFYDSRSAWPEKFVSFGEGQT